MVQNKWCHFYTHRISVGLLKKSRDCCEPSGSEDPEKGLDIKNKDKNDNEES